MLTSKISAERARELFNYDPETGLLTRKISTTNSVKVGDVAGSHHCAGYLSVRADGFLFLAHRLAWLIHTGAWPTFTIDHVNGKRADNRAKNLRDVPKAINNQNRHGTRAAVGFAGVQANGRKFVSKLTTGGRQGYLGIFATPEQAHQAYLTAKRQLHEGCTI